MSRHHDPYLVLGIPRGANLDQVKRAYRRLVLALHPDRGGDARAAARLREVQHAYEILNDPDTSTPDDSVPVMDEERSSRSASPEATRGEPVLEPRSYSRRRHAVRFRPEPLVPPSLPPDADPYQPETEPLPYATWRHAARLQPEPFASRTARQLSERYRQAFTPLDERLGGWVPEAFPHRPASTPKELFVELVLTASEARIGGTFPLVVPMEKPCQACLGSGLGSLTRYCSHCRGRGFLREKKELEIVVPAEVHDGQSAELELSGGPAPIVLRVAVRVA